MKIKADKDKGANPKTPFIRIKFRDDLTFRGFIKDNGFDLFCIICLFLLYIGG